MVGGELQDAGRFFETAADLHVAVLEILPGDGPGLVLGRGLLELFVIAAGRKTGGGSGAIHACAVLAQLGGIAGQQPAVVLPLLGLAVDVPAHGARRTTGHGTGQGAFHLAGGQAADEGTQQGAARGASRRTVGDPVFIGPQLGHRGVALGIIVDLCRLRAVFAGAAAEQGDARHCHDQKSEMTLDHVDLLGWMHGVSLFP